MHSVTRRHRSALTAILPVALLIAALSGGRTSAQQAGQGRGGQQPAAQAPAAQPPAQPQPAPQPQKPVDNVPRFEESTGVTLVLVDVTVRDSSGKVIEGLSAKDFSVKEDGKAQRIDRVQFQDVDAATPASDQTLNVLDGLETKLREEAQRAATSTKGETAAGAAAAALAEAEAIQNRRMMVLLFDVSSMQPEDTQRAVESAQKFVDDEMGDSDLISVVSIGSRLNVLSDFSSNREDLYSALQQLGYANGTLINPEAITTALTDDAATTDDSSSSQDTSFEDFNNDVRLRAIKTLCQTIAPLQQRKAMMYFSAGMQRSGNDNNVELNAATNTCRRGNVLLYPVDVRGLQAVVAGGGATSRSSGGVGLFNGSNALRGFQQQSQSTGTLATLAADTGGKMFTDSNDFGDAFKRVQKDLAAYYLLSYSSTNTARDGKFRRITVTVNRPGAKVENRQGYYAGRSFVNTNKRDRKAQLDDELAATLSSTDLPMVVGTGFFRQQNNSFYVPIAMAIPGFAVPVGTGAQKVEIDVKGEVRDEQGRVVARMPDNTIPVPVTPGADTLAGRQVFYESGTNLPPGRFTVKIVARENTGGSIGSFEAPIIVPQLHDDVLKVSSVVMSTQIKKADTNKSDNPLIRDGQQLLPNLTRTVARNQKMYFYYEVYDPSLVEQAPQLRTSMSFYRAGVKVFETPTVERTMIDEPNRKAVVFQFEVPAEQFKAGNYTCQINIIDEAAGKVSFPRLSFTVIN